MASFKKMGLADGLVEACTSLGYKEPTEIQEESIPYSLQGRDIIGLAQTGSGKTAAFSLPMLDALLKKPQKLFGCVLSPTRELAIQINENIQALGAVIGVQSCAIVGGMDMQQQAIALAKGPHIVVATPGRIVDHLESTKGFNMKHLKFLILDEADRLLGMDFGPEIEKILKVIPQKRQTMLFSATMTAKVEKLQRASLKNPVKIQVATKYSTVDTLDQTYLFIPAKYKDCYLAWVLNQSSCAAIVFVGTCDNAQRLALMLRYLGFNALPLHGKLSQSKRLGALSKFKATNSILIATDVASRGLDIPSVDLVINFDIPTHSKDYIHRVGRTARAGRSGRA